MKISKKRVIYTVIVTFIVVFSTTFSVLMTLERLDYRHYLQGEYSKNMYNLINSVQNIRTNLSKSVITGSREQNIIVFSEIFRHASNANDKLNSLPIDQQVVANTSKFLSQVGDYCYSLAKVSSEGKQLTEKEYETIDELEIQSYSLEKQLNNVLSDINQGKVKWGEIRKKGEVAFAKNKDNSLTEKFKGIQKQTSQYPALIYDGPFSDNTVEIKPRINNKKEVSKSYGEEAIRKAIDGKDIQNIKFLEETSKTKIASYRYEVSIKEKNNKVRKAICEVSKHGGNILYYIDNKPMGKPTLDPKKIEAKANEILKGMGYKDMVPTYKLNYKDYMLINYVYKENGVLIYPDQIKVKVTADEGTLIGIESDKYLVSHMDKRTLEKPKVTEKDAYKRVGKRLKIEKVSLSVVPTEMNKEALCYEFLGNYKGKKFIVYINAETGYEQRIIEIIDTPNGELTI